MQLGKGTTCYLLLTDYDSGFKSGKIEYHKGFKFCIRCWLKVFDPDNIKLRCPTCNQRLRTVAHGSKQRRFKAVARY